MTKRAVEKNAKRRQGLSETVQVESQSILEIEVRSKKEYTLKVSVREKFQRMLGVSI